MIYTTLKNINKSKNHSLFLRHAERFSLGNLHNSLSVLLTEKGKEDSVKLGTNLSFPEPINLFHSPVERCKQTAQHITIGLDQNKIANSFVGPIFNLGGPYVKGSWDDMVQSINYYGFADFVRKWFDGNISTEIVMPLEEAANTQLDIIVNQLKKDDASYINISHDWNLMLIREHFLKLKHEEIGLPDFLDGVISYIKNDKLYIVYLDKTYPISII